MYSRSEALDAAGAPKQVPANPLTALVAGRRARQLVNQMRPNGYSLKEDY